MSLYSKTVTNINGLLDQGVFIDVMVYNVCEVLELASSSEFYV